MNLLRQKAKPVSIFMTVLVLLLTVPYQAAFAEMVGTETVISMTKVMEARDYLNRIMTREDLRAVFVSYGLDPLEARARLDTLSNAEIVRLYDQIEHLPAGGSDLASILIGAGVIFIILLITDVLGYTEIFAFVRR